MAAYLRAQFPAQEPSIALVPWLHYRTSGHPLFLVTMVEYLLQQGWLRETAPADVGKTIEVLIRSIPDTLRQMIETRMARLTPEEQQALEAGSAAGVTFSAAVVAAGLEADVVQVEAQCEAFARRDDFLEAQGSVAWPDGTVAAGYGFRHALYHEVVYGQIPAARRQRLHRRIGLRLEQGYGKQVGGECGGTGHALEVGVGPAASDGLSSAGSRECTAPSGIPGDQ